MARLEVGDKVRRKSYGNNKDIPLGKVTIITHVTESGYRVKIGGGNLTNRYFDTVYEKVTNICIGGE